MQEKFVMKTVKRIAAIGTGVAMLGATLTGALAAPQLKEYPSPLVKAGIYDDANVFVVGDSASAEDTLGLVDISTNLQFMAKTPVVTSGTGVTVTGGLSKQVPLGMTLSNNSNLFDRALDRGDISTLFKGKITFRGTEYDVEEQMQFGNVNQTAANANTGPTIATSLSSSDDDYKTDVALEFQRDTIWYAYRFIDTLSAAEIGNVSTTHKLKVNMLGTPLRITAVSAASITAQVGEEHFMAEGDTLTYDGKVVTLEAVGSSNAVVSVDGESKVITTADSETVNGLEVTVDSVISKTNKGESSAVIVVGKDSSETYNDGDAFPGEDKDSPNWVWDIRAMSGGTSTYGTAGEVDNMVLRAENDVHYEDDSDKPPKVGSCLDLPNQYLQICLDSLTVSEDNYKELEMKYEQSTDLSDAGRADFSTSVATLKITFPVDDGIVLPAYTAGTQPESVSAAYSIGDESNGTTTVKTKEVYLYLNHSTPAGDRSPRVYVFYKDFSATPNKVKYRGSIQLNTTGKEVLELAYDNTKSTNMVLENVANASETSQNFTWDINGDTATTDLVDAADDIVTSWGLSAGKVAKLGVTSNTEEGTELYWGAIPTALGTKDEDHRTLYGIKLLNPKSSSSSDRVRLMVPNDQVKMNVVIKGKAATVTGGGVSYVPAKVTPKTMLASEVTDPTKYNLVIVGGPCANPLAETLFGVTCDGWSLQEGEAMVKLVDNGNKVALLVAGTTALDTRRAAKAVANAETYLKTIAKSEAVVKGATLNDINVE